jgi:hypothetical protein
MVVSYAEQLEPGPRMSLGKRRVIGKIDKSTLRQVVLLTTKHKHIIDIRMSGTCSLQCGSKVRSRSEVLRKSVFT